MVRHASASRSLAPVLASIGLAALLNPAQGQNLAQAQVSPPARAAFTAQGFIEPSDGIISIGTAATGVIERIAAAPGEHVRLGQELVKIDCAPLEADVRTLAGQALAAQAVDDRVRHGSRPAEIAVGEANLGVAKARADEAVEALRRARALQVGISVTQAVLLQVERDARISGAQLEDARARLDLLRSGSRDEDIAEADARRDAATAALDAARARLAQCTIASPIDGIVVARFVSKGQFVSAAVPSVLLWLANDKSLSVRAEVEDTHLADLCVRQRASVVLPGQGNGVLAATVARITPLVIGAPSPGAPRQGEPAPGHVEVILRLDQQNPGILAGEDVMVHFEPCGS
jgi:HlyD family secretion protein